MIWGALVAIVVGVTAYLGTGILLIARRRAPGCRAGPILVHLVLPVALVSLLQLLADVIDGLQEPADEPASSGAHGPRASEPQRAVVTASNAIPVTPAAAGSIRPASRSEREPDGQGTRTGMSRYRYSSCPTPRSTAGFIGSIVANVTSSPSMASMPDAR